VHHVQWVKKGKRARQLAKWEGEGPRGCFQNRGKSPEREGREGGMFCKENWVWGGGGWGLLGHNSMLPGVKKKVQGEDPTGEQRTC